MGNGNLIRGFTLMDLLAVVVVVGLLAVLLLLANTRVHSNSRPIKDSTQVRGIHQGMVLWAQNNSDAYPLPSLIDLKDETVAEQGRAKDTTANIFSILIYNGFFSPELCVSAAESNPAIRICDTYAYSNPTTATNPAMALWDPAFSADFTGGKTGNFSYGHTLPAEARLVNSWVNNFGATQAALGNRGPEIKGFGVSRGSRMYVAAGKSNTFLIHGGKDAWEGNIAYNDNHVNFETTLAPEWSTYPDKAGDLQPDCLFSDEPDDASEINNYLGIFTGAGATKAEYRAIWD